MKETKSRFDFYYITCPECDGSGAGEMEVGDQLRECECNNCNGNGAVKRWINWADKMEEIERNWENGRK